MKSVRNVTILIALVMLVQGIWAQYPVNENGQSPFVNVVKNSGNAVVQIKVEGELENSRDLSAEVFPFYFPYQRMPQSRPFKSMGSGFIIKYDERSREAWIVTNNHVVEKGDKGTITVTLADKRKYEAEIIGLDDKTDLAVIKITVDKDEKITSLDWGSSTALNIGDWVIAIGNPFGDVGLDRTVTVGVVSAKGRSGLNFGQGSPVYQDYIQTDASINPGNSGGPLIGISGKVVGVNAAITSPNGGNIGIGFAIPSGIAQKVVTDIINDGSVQRAYLGIAPQEIDDTLKDTFELKEIAGVLVSQVVEDTPADKAGLQKGDVILEIDDMKVPNVALFRIAIAHRPIGVPVTLKITRKNKIKYLKATLTKYPEDDENGLISKTEAKTEEVGIEVVDTDSEIGEKLKLDKMEGVIIKSIKDGSPADKAGLKVGLVILEVNEEKVSSVKEYDNKMKSILKSNKDSDNRVVLLYVAGKQGNKRFVAVELD